MKKLAKNSARSLRPTDPFRGKKSLCEKLLLNLGVIGVALDTGAVKSSQNWRQLFISRSFLKD